MSAPPELVVVMPAYDEQEQLPRVLDEWRVELSRLAISFELLVVDDGSRDRTAAVAEGYSRRHPAIRVVSKPHSGHGPSCLHGYRAALERHPQWVLQLDSDGQCDPAFFAQFWDARNDAPVVWGVRLRRDDGLGRTVITGACNAVVWLAAGVRTRDVNVPYRLIQARVLAAAIAGFPETYHLANVFLGVILQRALGREVRFIAIRFRRRHGGSTSIRWSQFASWGVKLLVQLIGARPFLRDRSRAVRTVVEAA
jgi:glycosyltransferase involved in cell wall biosynthesis